MELLRLIEEAAASISDENTRKNHWALSECLNKCCALKSPPEQHQAAIALSDAYCKLCEVAMRGLDLGACRLCMLDCEKLNAMFPKDEHIAHQLLLCVTGVAHTLWFWEKEDRAGEYMEKAIRLAKEYSQNIEIQRDAGVCMGTLVELCGNMDEYVPVALDGIERMEAIAERFPEDEELQTIYAHILVFGCQFSHRTADQERFNALENKLQALMDENANIINTQVVRERLQSNGTDTKPLPEQEEADEREVPAEEPMESKRCRDIRKSIEKVASHIPGWELARSGQVLHNCLDGCKEIESPEEKRQTVAALADVYGKLARWSMECRNLQCSRDCVRDCRALHSMFKEDEHIALILLRCLTGLTFVKHKQREHSMAAEHIDEVLELAAAYPKSVEVQSQAAMCMGNLVALCGNPNLSIDLAYDAIERMEAVAERFPRDSDLQNVYAHILVSGCYYANHTGSAERLDEFRGKLSEMEEQRIDVIDMGELRRHLAQIGLR